MSSWFQRELPPASAHTLPEELLLFLDGELSPWKAERVRRHLDACWACRSLRQRMESAISSYVELDRSLTGAELPPKGWREFETRLEQRLRSEEPPRRVRHWFGMRRSHVAAMAVLLVVGMAVAALWIAPREAEPRQNKTRTAPARELAPGAVSRRVAL